MSYKLEIPKDMLHRLWILKTYLAEPPIAQQLRTAVNDYLKKQIEKIGCPLEDVEEVIDRKKEFTKNDEPFPNDKIAERS